MGGPLLSDLMSPPPSPTASQMAAINSNPEANDLIASARPESHLTARIKEKIEKLPDLPDNPCIYRIPKNLRSVNEKAYSPCRVAIGPYHADDPALMPMNQHKLKCLKSLISRNTNLQVENYVEAITSGEDNARKYYAGIEDLKSDEFVEMLLIDGAFIIEYLCIIGGIHSSNHYLDVIRFGRIMSEIRRDLMVLENQLPFFIIDQMYNLTYVGSQVGSQVKPFSLIVYNMLKYMVPFGARGKYLGHNDVLDRVESTTVLHFVHFMTLCCIPLPKEIYMNALITVDTPDDSNTLCQPFLSATELHEAGVKFKKIASDKPLLQMKFNNGVLEIPHLELVEFTEMFFRNIMAFEQYYLKSYDVTSYMYLMDHLVDTEKDVQILQQGHIIENWLESKHNATAVFNVISKHTVTDYSIALRIMCKDMNTYASRPWNQRMAMLRRDYFGSPWAVISFLAALLLLVLTAIQTVASVLQAK